MFFCLHTGCQINWHILTPFVFFEEIPYLYQLSDIMFHFLYYTQQISLFFSLHLCTVYGDSQFIPWSWSSSLIVLVKLPAAPVPCWDTFHFWSLYPVAWVSCLNYTKFKINLSKWSVYINLMLLLHFSWLFWGQLGVFLHELSVFLWVTINNSCFILASQVLQCNHSADVWCGRW